MIDQIYGKEIEEDVPNKMRISLDELWTKDFETEAEKEKIMKNPIERELKKQDYPQG